MNEQPEQFSGMNAQRRDEGLSSRPAVGDIALAGAAGDNLARATDRVAAIVERLSGSARAEACVGPPQSAAGRTLLPLAAVRVSAGWGFGFGGGSGTDTGNRNAGSGTGGGGGGGGNASSRVIAIAEISDEGVRMRPIPDVTTMALGLMALIAL